MKRILLTAVALCALLGCTEEPQIVDRGELMEEALAERDFWGADDDSPVSDEEPDADADAPAGDTDDLLSDD